VADELDETLVRAVDDGAVDIAHLDFVDAHAIADRFARLALRHADVARLRIGVERPRNVVVRHRRLSGEEDVAHELDRFEGRDVCELQAAVYVAAGPDARHGRLQIFVDDDERAVRGDSDAVEAERVDVSAASRGDEDLVDGDLARLRNAVLDPRDLLSAARAHRLHAPAGVQRHTLLGENLPDARDDIRIFLVDDLGGHFDDGDLAAEAAEHLRELDADRSAAEDQQRLRELVAVEKRRVIDELRIRETFDRRHRGASAGRDHDVFASEDSSIDLDLIARDELRAAEDDVDAEAAEFLRIVVMLDAMPLGAHGIHDRARRDRRFVTLESEDVRVAHLMC